MLLDRLITDVFYSKNKPSLTDKDFQSFKTKVLHFNTGQVSKTEKKSCNQSYKWLTEFKLHWRKPNHRLWLDNWRACKRVCATLVWGRVRVKVRTSTVIVEARLHPAPCRLMIKMDCSNAMNKCKTQGKWIIKIVRPSGRMLLLQSSCSAWSGSQFLRRYCTGIVDVAQVCLSVSQWVWVFKGLVAPGKKQFFEPVGCGFVHPVAPARLRTRTSRLRGLCSSSELEIFDEDTQTKQSEF